MAMIKFLNLSLFRVIRQHQGLNILRSSPSTTGLVYCSRIFLSTSKTGVRIFIQIYSSVKNILKFHSKLCCSKVIGIIINIGSDSCIS